MIAGSCSGDNNNETEVSSKIVTALQHTRRRRIVEHVHVQAENTSLVTLASHLAADTDDTLPDVVVELHDHHLPELTDCGLVEYEADTGAVTLAVESEIVEAALDRASGGP